MSLDLYYLPISGSSRAIQMTAKAVGIKLNLKYLDLMKKEQLKPDFLKINPQHTIPTLVDNGFALWESRAILIYLVEKYGKNDSLYPKDPEKRAIVNQRLFFDLGTFYQSYTKYGYPKSLAPNAPVDPEAFKNFEIAVAYLETFLENSKYVAGDTLTIADISLVVTVSVFEIINYDISNYPNILRWYDLCKRTVPGWDINEAGIITTRQYLETHRQQHQQQQQQQQ